MRFINKIKDTWKQLFQEITVVEYVFWWILRIAMIYAIIDHPDPREKTMIGINTAALFAMPLLRLIFPRNGVVSRMSFRCQNIINFFELIGTFFGNYLNAYAYVAKYDRLLHIFSGFGVVVAGYYVFKAFECTDDNDRLHYIPKSPGLAVAFSTMFSFTLMVFWEITEFFGDYLFGTENQGYNYSPPEGDIMYRIFGHPCQEGQGAVWDTMMDMIDATVTTIITAVIMLIILTLRKKYAEKKLAQADQSEAMKVTA